MYIFRPREKGISGISHTIPGPQGRVLYRLSIFPTGGCGSRVLTPLPMPVQGCGWGGRGRLGARGQVGVVVSAG